MSDAEIDNRTNWVNAILLLMIAVPIGLLIYQFTRPSPVVLKEKVAFQVDGSRYECYLTKELRDQLDAVAFGQTETPMTFELDFVPL